MFNDLIVGKNFLRMMPNWDSKEEKLVKFGFTEILNFCPGKRNNIEGQMAAGNKHFQLI